MKAIEIAVIEFENFDLTEDRIRYELKKVGIDPESEIDNEKTFVQSKSFELMKAGYILNYILSNPESWGQGDMNEKRNFDALKSYVSSVYRKHGLNDPFADQSKKPIIRRL